MQWSICNFLKELLFLGILIFGIYRKFWIFELMRTRIASKSFFSRILILEQLPIKPQFSEHFSSLFPSSLISHNVYTSWSRICNLSPAPNSSTSGLLNAPRSCARSQKHTRKWGRHPPRNSKHSTFQKDSIFGYQFFCILPAHKTREEQDFLKENQISSGTQKIFFLENKSRIVE